jgi:hypothetical protein
MRGLQLAARQLRIVIPVLLLFALFGCGVVSGRSGSCFLNVVPRMV